MAIKAATNAMDTEGFTNANNELMEDGNSPCSDEPAGGWQSSTEGF